MRTDGRALLRRPAGGLSSAEWVLVLVALGLVIVAGISQSKAEPDHVVLGAVGAVLWLPLLLAGRFPRAVLAVVVVIQGVYVGVVTLAGPVQFNSAPFVVMVAVYVVAVRRPWRQAWAAGGLAAVTLLAVSAVERPSLGQQAANLFAFDLVLAATGLGVLVRSRHQRLLAMERRAVEAEQTREEEARRRVADERLRMARELHDVVAHNLTLVNAQAGVAGFLLHDDPVAAEKALRSISEHTRQALDELRATVGLLRRPDEDEGEDPTRADRLRPVAGLDDLPDLLATHRGSGARVDLVVTGAARELPAVADLAAYRIVQEALTNARKHAPGASVDVRLDWTADHLAIQVENAPPVPPGQRGSGTGHGLLGMRERAHAAGTELDAVALAGGGFRVAVAIPYVPPPTEESS